MARERAGLSEEEMGERVGIGVASYRDLESDDTEVFMCLSLAHLRVLGRILGVSPRILLLGEDAPVPGEPVSFSEISAHLNALRAAKGVTVDDLSDQVGWELRDVLVDPEKLWTFNVDGLRDLCRAIQADWVAALPD
jgi:transcriptional regulator with XRE-family HTH domain